MLKNTNLNNRVVHERERERERERVNAVAQIFSFENLLKCYYECRKRKRFTANALQFEINFEEELLKLQKELKSHTYTPGRSICFVVTKPKYREIFAANAKCPFLILFPTTSRFLKLRKIKGFPLAI